MDWRVQFKVENLEFTMTRCPFFYHKILNMVKKYHKKAKVIGIKIYLSLPQLHGESSNRSLPEP